MFIALDTTPFMQTNTFNLYMKKPPMFQNRNCVDVCLAITMCTYLATDAINYEGVFGVDDEFAIVR